MNNNERTLREDTIGAVLLGRRPAPLHARPDTTVNEREVLTEGQLPPFSNNSIPMDGTWQTVNGTRWSHNSSAPRCQMTSIYPFAPPATHPAPPANKHTNRSNANLPLALITSIHSALIINENCCDYIACSCSHPNALASAHRYKFYVFSAFFDNRKGQRAIRVIGATKMRGPERVWCRLWYKFGENNGTTFTSKTVVAKIKVTPSAHRNTVN